MNDFLEASMHNLNNHAHNDFDFSKARVLVVGDVMSDQYWHGSTARISPEAPVPVVNVNRVDERLGGAANVALGVAALGAKSYLLGLIGQDDTGLKLETLVKQHNIQSHLICVPNTNTITKLRILSRNQQMIRLDKEKHFNAEYGELLIETYQSLLSEIDLVILSDYGKGTLTHAKQLIQLARKYNIPVLVDPKSLDFELYRHATVVTPNLKEFEAVVGPSETTSDLVLKAKTLLQQFAIDTLIITRSEAGMSIIEQSGAVTHIPAQAREVHDVTGAGDTVMAVLGVCLALKMDVLASATLGNIAAGVAVSKLGTAAVSYAELMQALGKKQTLPTGVMTEEQLLNLIRTSKAQGERIVFTNGCFDILHAGHILYLEQAKALGDRVIVAVNDDVSVKRLKGSKRPINTLADRMALLAGLRAVDWVVSFSEDTPSRLIEAISPHVLVKGGDYQIIQEIPGAAYVTSLGGEVKLLGLKEGLSTTSVIEKITTEKTESFLLNDPVV